MTKAITWSANPRFTADSASAGRSTLRVVVTLNGGGGFSGRDPCPGKAEGGGQLPDGRVREIATFCDGEDVLANVHGHVGRSAGVDDPRFSRLIRQVTRDMFAVTNGT
jgi:hypothetical protein